MPRQTTALAVLATALCVVAEEYTFCTEDTCGDCPVSITTIGTGYPDCAIYNSMDVFGNQGFEQTNKNISAFIDIPQQDESAPCYIIFKSPADLEQPGCGLTQKYFQDATCGDIVLDNTFMVQFCCGRGDCAAAGIPNQGPGSESSLSMSRSAKFGRGINAGDLELSASGGGLKSMRIAVNGTEIKPAYVGPPRVASNFTTDAQPISKRGGVCDGDWSPEPGKEDYTRPADGPQILSSVVESSEFTVEVTRTQEWTTTIDASLGFEDILSLGVGFSESFSESLSNSESYTFTFPEGESGYVGWTSYLRCSQGTGTCNDEEVSGEVCTPYLDRNSGKLAGRYIVVQEG
ncbi:hypothetical protein F5B22DRAFT_649263 [Xylaria bambusicola]|uniref:uncharacterized protein n=1 Tax=Xylaria bambusicola TaxID=326684 RepID=UPI0020084B5D|nr:uncharacterized protein F5B22DRAFT_649263 [Xylaria bambusicola]KAI0509215.1 hypothetical protein F5B22DRAFT_649263 [Xylaria bambusicola]